MTKFMFHGSYTAAGAAGVLTEGGSGRERAVKELAESVGGSLESIYWAMGKDDFYIVANMPDAHAAAALSLAVGASGSATVTTAQLFDAAAVDEIISQRAKYRAPGS